MHSYVRPDQFVLLRLPNELTRIQKVTPNTYVLRLSAGQSQPSLTRF